MFGNKNSTFHPCPVMYLQLIFEFCISNWLCNVNHGPEWCVEFSIPIQTMRRRKEDEAAGAAYQTGHCKTVEPTHNSPHHFQAFLGKILILPTCRILINSFCLFLKEPRKPSFDKGRGLNRSKFQMYTRKIF